MKYRLEIHADDLKYLVKKLQHDIDYRIYQKIIDNESGVELSDEEMKQILILEKKAKREAT